VPTLRPFRALRYGTSGTDLSAVLCPPYDVIDGAERKALLARDAHNAVRLELPAEAGQVDPAAYREAARTAAEWRSDGILVKDRQPTITLHRMTWGAADGRERSSTGVFARLRLEPFGPRSGILPHERTMSGPKEDRYQLLRATGLNTSPIVLLAHDEPEIASALAELTADPPDAHAETSDGVRHALWVQPVAATDGARESASDPAGLLERLASAPLTIADGHHRFETALRYREERGRNRACESDPAWDYVLALLYPVGQAPPALPTHRVFLDGPTGDALLTTLEGLFRVEDLPDRATLLARMADGLASPAAATGTGRIGVLGGDRAAVLSAPRPALEALLPAGLSEASRGLDVNRIGAALGHVFGVDAGTLAEAGRLRYVKDAAEATRLVESGEAASCFLLDPMPASAITRVAAAGEVMPHKSTYFHPKAPTGLLFSPLEW
jgi:uncharacterized protein (DUF1015 family)